MRSTLDVICDVKDGKPVTEEELKLALLSLNAVEFFSHRLIERLAKEYQNPQSVAVGMSKAEAKEWPERRVQMLKTPMDEFLGPENTPGTTEYENLQRLGKEVVKAATGIEL